MRRGNLARRPAPRQPAANPLRTAPRSPARRADAWAVRLDPELGPALADRFEARFVRP